MRFTTKGLLVLVCAASSTSALDWPQWRGPNQDGKSLESGVLRAWPKGGPDVVWRKASGEGYSGMSVVEERLYTQFADSTNEYLVCLDAGTGSEFWRVQMDSL